MKRVLLLLVAALASCGSGPEGSWSTLTLGAPVAGPKYYTEQHGATAHLRLVADTSGSVVTGLVVSVNDTEGKPAPTAPTVVVESPAGATAVVSGASVVVTFANPVSNAEDIVLSITVPADAPQPWRCLVVPSMRAP
jgi:hypothetical protein